MASLPVKFVYGGAAALAAEWPDAANFIDAERLEIAVIDHGMESGAPSVIVRVTTPTGIVITETSARLFVSAAKMIEARYPDLLK